MKDFFLNVAALLYIAIGLGTVGLLVWAILTIGLRRRRQRQAVEAMDDDADSFVASDREDVDDDGSIDLDPTEMPAGVRMPKRSEKMVRLFATMDVTRADLLRATLLDAGIWCYADGHSNALGPVGLAEVSLHVPEGDVERARDLIAEADREAEAEAKARTETRNENG